ncbi:Hypothetical protein ETEE_2011 [Edwardsiella anguillarum ET080813]|uniref:Uncharacterized protein n=1 Tax=Edwardsiella anguillarum ET080813 TaxID=667120 RepID=A0A076LKP1_9GAMM|nr:Hypothetical protein ETEE_2011 [Edwardsiella anguillarum ET080813]
MYIKLYSVLGMARAVAEIDITQSAMRILAFAFIKYRDVIRNRQPGISR